MDVTEDVTCTLRAEAHHPPCILEEAVAVENHPMDGRDKLEENGKVQTLSERMGTGGMNVPLVLKIRSGCEGGGKGALIQENKSATLGCNNNQTLFEPCTWDGNQTAPTLTANNAGGNQRMPDKQNFNCVVGVNLLQDPINAEDKTPCLSAGSPTGQAALGVCTEYIVRRLTPLECERLQGFPDGWTKLPKIEDMTDEEYEFFLRVYLLDKKINGKSNIKPPKRASMVKWYNKLSCDGNRYKALGNSLAIPCALRVIGGIADYITKKGV